MFRNAIRLNTTFSRNHRPFPSRSSSSNASTSSKSVMTTPKKQGAGFFQRLSSFVVGAGISALASQYYIYQELVNGNDTILKKQKEIEKRLSSLEKKK